MQLVLFRSMARDVIVVASLIVSVLLTLRHPELVDGCYLRNCPIGGKRALGSQQHEDDTIARWINQLKYAHDVS